MKRHFILLFLLPLLISCGFPNPGNFILENKRYKNPQKVNLENGYTYQLRNIQLDFPKNWEPNKVKAFYLHSPVKINLKDTLSQYGAYVRVEILPLKLRTGFKKFRSKDSLHYYNSLWSNHVNPKWNPKIKIFKSKNSNGEFYINDSRYTTKSLPVRIISMIYFKDNLKYVIRFYSTGNNSELYYAEAMKIFESVRIK